jgi:cytochrome c oxidase assembly protein subunit 15
VKLGAFQALALGTVAAIYVLIVLGGLVSSTGSGLACPDWPLCNGQVIPAITLSVLIEFTHRVWSILVTTLVVATMLFAWRAYRWSAKVTKLSTLTFILLVDQVVLGMVTVRSGTMAIVVTAHLAVATLVFASALTTALTSLLSNSKRVRVS